ncbi:hypothetical protein L9F63_023973, partial [Diploptera punctata]
TEHLLKEEKERGGIILSAAKYGQVFNLWQLNSSVLEGHSRRDAFFSTNRSQLQDDFRMGVDYDNKTLLHNGFRYLALRCFTHVEMMGASGMLAGPPGSLGSYTTEYFDLLNETLSEFTKNYKSMPRESKEQIYEST